MAVPTYRNAWRGRQAVSAASNAMRLIAKGQQQHFSRVLDGTPAAPRLRLSPSDTCRCVSASPYYRHRLSPSNPVPTYRYLLRTIYLQPPDTQPGAHRYLYIVSPRRSLPHGYRTF